MFDNNASVFLLCCLLKIEHTKLTNVVHPPLLLVRVVTAGLGAAGGHARRVRMHMERAGRGENLFADGHDFTECVYSPPALSYSFKSLSVFLSATILLWRISEFVPVASSLVLRRDPEVIPSMRLSFFI